MRAVCPEESLTCRREQGAPPSGSLERGAAEMCFLFPPLSSPEGQQALTSPPPTRHIWSLAPLALPCPLCAPLLHRAPFVLVCVLAGLPGLCPSALKAREPKAAVMWHPCTGPSRSASVRGGGPGWYPGWPGASKSSSASRANVLRAASGLW